MNLGWMISSAALIFSLVVTWWVHSQYHLALRVDPAQQPTGPLPLVSILIPARNEARNIAACLESVRVQSYTNIEIIVVDDRSTDATPTILAHLAAQEPRLKVIHGADLPPGWAGKPHALFQGAQAARGDWLCFLDADTFAHPTMIAASLVSAQQTQADLFTIMTDQKLVTFWEKVILPLVFTALSVGFSPRKVNDPARPDAIANGQFLLFRRAAYEAIGGHAAVASSIVEDRYLARRIKAAGLRLVVADGRDLAVTRMYTSFSEIWQGWTKNIYLGLSDSPGLAVLGIFGALICLLGGLGFPTWIIIGIDQWVRGAGPAILLEALLAFAVLLIMRVQAGQAFHISPFYALTLPLGALIFAAMMATSTLQVLTGQGVTWKGRRYLAKS